MPAVDDAHAQDEYDVWHRQREEMGEGSNPLSHAWYRDAYADAHKHAPKRVLEVGCGNGAFSRLLSRDLNGARVDAIDFSSVAIAAATRTAQVEGSPVVFSVGDAARIAYPDCSFDYVVSCECMEHVSDPFAMAREVRRVLQPGGRFCVTTENYFNGMILAWIVSYLRGTPFNSGSGVQPRENFFVFWRVAKILKQAGLIVDETKSSHYQWLLLPRTDPSILCTEHFQSSMAKRLAKPFGRHFTFCGSRPRDA